jgi:D-lactate dehydrogenase
MKIAMFSTKSYDQRCFEQANRVHGHGHEITFLEPRLVPATAPLADGHECVCAFVNDDLGREVLTILRDHGVRLVALRSAGFNHVDVEAADDLGLTVVRVPAYSPHAVAEHALTLILALNRKVFRAYNRVRDGNFSLEGLLGFDLHGRTVGVIGTGRIGLLFASIMRGIGCEVLGHDPHPNPEAEEVLTYVDLDELLGRSHIVSLHVPLTPKTRHIINVRSIAKMRDGVMLINTSRGQLVDTAAVIDGLKSGRIGYLGLDVYEEEEALFFQDHSTTVIQDDTFTRLLTLPNVLITGHQGFFTQEAVTKIAETTLENVTAYATGEGTLHRVEPLKPA